MKIIARVVSCAAVLGLALGTGLHASTQWAVTADQNSVYVVKYDGGTPTTASAPAGLLPGANFTGIAVWHDYVLLTDSSTTQAQLRIGRLHAMASTPRVEWLDSISLQLTGTSTYLTNPAAIAVNSDGGVYVLGNSSQLSNYAYIPYVYGWSPGSMAINDVSNGYLRDVDAGGIDTGATIALKGYTNDHSMVTSAVGGAVASPVETGDRGNQPRAIAEGTNGLSYIANWVTADSDGFVDVPGSISVISSGLGSAVASAVLTPDFQPNDISFFTRDGVNYLGIVGITTSGVNQAWRVTLDPSGIPMMDSGVQKLTLSSGSQHSNSQRVDVSPDGSTLWVTDPGWKGITAIDTGSDWTGHQLVMTSGAPVYVGTYVPEPGSLVAILTGLVGLAGLRRRRE